MPFPAGLTLITVTGVLAGEPDPAIRRARFRCTRWLSGPAADALVAPFVIHADVDQGTGAFTVELPATDDPAWSPTDWAYEVVLHYAGHGVGGSLEVAYDGGAFNLADRININQDAATGTSYILSALRGVAGGVAALDGDGKVPAAQLPASAGGDPDWSEITGKPATFPPTLPIAQSGVTNLVADLSALEVATLALDDRVAALEDAPGGGAQLVVRRGTVTSGNLTLAVAVGWTAVAGGPSMVLPAAVGDYVEFTLACALANFGVNFVDLAVVAGGSLVRYLSTDTATPATEGAPSFYGDQAFDRFGPLFAFEVEAGDLDGGNVTVVFATKGSGGGTIYATADYPLRWRALNHGPADVA